MAPSSGITSDTSEPGCYNNEHQQPRYRRSKSFALTSVTGAAITATATTAKDANIRESFIVSLSKRSGYCGTWSCGGATHRTFERAFIDDVSFDNLLSLAKFDPCFYLPLR